MYAAVERVAIDGARLFRAPCVVGEVICQEDHLYMDVVIVPVGGGP